MTDPEFNPYAAPMESGAPQADTAEGQEVTIRRQHIAHEASTQSFGFLFYLGGVLLLLFAAAAVVGVASGARIPSFMLVFGAVYGLVGTFQIIAGYQLRKLSQAGRVCATVLGVIGLLGVPIGTLISGYLLYLLWSPKGNMIFSPEYQRIRKLTPHVKYKTPLYLTIIVLLLIGLVVFSVLSIAFV